MKRKLKLLFVLALGWLFIQALLGSCSDSDKQLHRAEECTLQDHELKDVTGTADSGSWSTDEVVIDFVDDLTDDEIHDIGEEVGLSFKHSSSATKEYNTVVAEVSEGAVPLVHSHLMRHGYADLIESVGENITLHAFAWEPDDPMYQYQWNMDQVEAIEAWTLSSGSGVVVAVIDTGVAFGEDKERGIRPVADLKQTERVPGYDFVDNDSFPWDGHGHGTHVAGTIAQSTNNGYGVSGLAYRSTIMPIRVLDSNGSGSAAQVADGIRFAADNGADVINMSLGSSVPSRVIKSSVEHAHEENVTIVAAAGNSGKRAPGYPAAQENVIAVAATQFDGHTTFYSQWGPFVDIAAPGGNTRVDQNGDGRPDGVLQETVKSRKPNEHFFGMFMGTSMASPHVAATAALVQEWGVTHPNAVESILKKTTDTSLKASEGSEDDGDDGDDGGDDGHYDEKEYSERYGAGLIQADSAVTSAILDPGLLRALLALLLGVGLFFLARGENYLEADAKRVGIYAASALYFACGLFFLPLIVPGMEIPIVASIVKTLSMPLAAWDFALLGLGQTPVLASFLVPLGLVALLHGHATLRYLAVGCAIGFAGFCMAEAFMLTKPVLWIPGGDLGARFYLGAMSLANLALGFLALKDD